MAPTAASRSPQQMTPLVRTAPGGLDPLHSGIWPRLRVLSLALGLGLPSLACTTHHWAEVKTSKLPPPPTERVLHTGPLIVEITEKTDETQCVVYEQYSPVCFYNVRPAVEDGLVRGLWPSFPDARLGTALDAEPGDYVLQVELELDALPPDGAGPGWSAGVRGRYRLLRDEAILHEATLSSRSRADLPYGAPLGLGATDVVDAAVVHIVSQVSALPETRPDPPVPLPAVAARIVTPSGKGAENGAPTAPSVDDAVAPSTRDDDPASPAAPATKQAKSAEKPKKRAPSADADNEQGPPPPAPL